MTDTTPAPFNPADHTRDEVDAKILELIDSTDDTQSAIARTLGVPQPRVSRVARKHGRSFDASRTELARQAKALDVKKKQADIASMLLVRAEEALLAMDQAVETMPQYVSRTEHEPGGWKSKRIDAPSISDRRALAQTAALAAKTARDLLGSTTTGDVSSGVSMLRGMATAFGQAAESMEAGGTDDPTLEP